MMSEEETVSYLENLFEVVERNKLDISVFEITTMLAFLKFRDAKIDYAVLECGIGGRLDCTNIVTPVATAIASVGLDHQEVLGETEEEIAEQKAGIIKPGVPMICGRVVPHHVVKAIAESREAPFILATPTSLNLEEERYFMDDNHDVVIAILRSLKETQGLEITEEIIEKGLTFNQPCRMEKVPLQYLENLGTKTRVVYLDVSHNISALERVFSQINTWHAGAPVRVVCGFSKMKDIKKMMHYLLKRITKLNLVSCPHFRLANIESMISQALEEEKASGKEGIIEEIIDKGNVSLSLKKALEDATENEIIIICGSFFIMEEARQFLGYQEPCDPKGINN